MPDRLALMGDVHANAPALRAVLAAIEDAGLSRGACTGDLVMRGDRPEECYTPGAAGPDGSFVVTGADGTKTTIRKVGAAPSM